MIKQAIIPLAGLGTRLLPLTSVIPKELLPINGKPGIEYILDECIESGITEIIFIISKKKKFFISTHLNPDGDSLGSASSMYYYLKQLGKDCRIINHSDVPKVYSFLNNNNIFEQVNDDNTAFIKSADLGIILDVGDFYRLGKVANIVENTKIETINIDHHPLTENDFFTHISYNVGKKQHFLRMLF